MIQASACSRALVFVQYLAQVGRAFFFFAFEEKLDIDLGTKAGATNSVVGVKYGKYAGFIVGGSPGIEAPIGIDGSARRGKVDKLPALVEWSAGQLRFERRQTLGPLIGIHRLAVVMGVKDEGSGGAGAYYFAVYRGDSAFGVGMEQTHVLDASFFHHTGDILRVGLQLRGVVHSIGYSEEVHVFLQQFIVAGLVVGADFFDGFALAEKKMGAAG